MNLCQRSPDHLNKVINNFLDRYGLAEEDPIWEIRQSPLGGLGLFVKRSVKIGEVIFKDFPVILGPRCVSALPKYCVCCFSKTNLQICEKGCGLPVCSDSCQNAFSHIRECKILRQHNQNGHTITTDEGHGKLFENLAPVKALLLNKEDREVILGLVAHNRDQHGHEIDTLKNKLGFHFKEDDEMFLRFVCCVLDANAFEVTVKNEDDESSLRGLYPLGSLTNHSCVPNMVHVFDENHHMVARAAVFIPKDSEIFHSYTRILWGTPSRLFHLHQTKHFVCKCVRCQDPTEFGTFMGSVLCEVCRGIVSPVNPYKSFGRWQCRDCKKFITGKDAGDLLVMLGAILQTTEDKEFYDLYRILKCKLNTIVPETNQVAVGIKYKIVWILGHKDGFKWNDLTIKLLKIKEEFCRDLIELLATLRCGRSKVRGLLLYELFCCKREIINRGKMDKQNLITADIQRILIEAAEILRYDVSAPEEIQNFNINNTPVNNK